jgi:hypothetical protein
MVMAWKDVILNNFAWKVTALVLATAVWLTFKWERHGEALELRTPDSLLKLTSSADFVGLPVRVLKSPGDFREFRLSPNTIDVTIAGESALLKKLRGSDLLAFVDVTLMGEDVITNLVQIHGPPGIQLVQADPAVVTLEEIRRDDRSNLPSTDGLVGVKSFIPFPNIPVRVLKTAGDPKTYRVDPVVVTVRVSGDLALLEKLSASEIRAFVDLTEMDRDAATNRVVMSAPAGLKLEQAIPASVRVERVDPGPTPLSPHE